MVTKVSAFKTDDGQVFPDEAAAIKHELYVFLVPMAGCTNSPNIIEWMIDNDSKITALLSQYRRLVPHPPLVTKNAA